MSIGRNAPCPCGSGRKYKKCCLSIDEARERAELRDAQRTLWDEDGGRSDADDDVSKPAVIAADERPPVDLPRVRRIVYATGFVRTLDEADDEHGLAETVWTAPIPAPILDCLERERVAELEGEWGDPTTATPIHVEQIELTAGDGVVTVDVFNRALLLLTDNTEETRRLHRVCVALEQAARQSGARQSAASSPEQDSGSVRLSASAPDTARRGTSRSRRSASRVGGQGYGGLTEAAGQAPHGEGEQADRHADLRADRPDRASRIDFDALLKAHRNQGGACELCGVSLTRRSAARHFGRCAPEHDVTAGFEQSIVRLRVTAPGAPAYWLDVEARQDAKLEALDSFLRNIWLECCGHLSQFRTAAADYVSSGYDLGFASIPGFASRRVARRMTARLGEVFSVIGERVTYEYDFGSTTGLLITVAAGRSGRIGRHGVRLLARNTPPAWPCERCGDLATSLCAECWASGEYGAVCRAHERTHGCDEPSYLPVVNSPRMGVCGYTGE